MEIKEVKFNESLILSILPPGMWDIAKREGTHIFGVMIDDMIRALAVVSLSDDGRPGYILNHVDVATDEDPQIIISLINHVNTVCKSSGSPMLICRFIDSKDRLLWIHDLMRELSFEPLLLNGHRLIYSLKGIEEFGFDPNAGALRPLLPRVFPYEKVKGVQYNKFYETLRRMGRAPSSQIKDLKYDRYFEYKGNIVGYINSTEVEEDILFLADVFVLDSQIKKYVLPTMFASMIASAKTELSADSALILNTTNEVIYNGIKSIFGEPIAEEMVFEYLAV